MYPSAPIVFNLREQTLKLRFRDSTEHLDCKDEEEMIHGAHVIIYSKDAEADRAFFRDVLKYESADAGHGWLIFALPPAEVAIHPSEANDVHELYFMCDDVHAFIAEMQKKNVNCAPI